MSFKMKYMTLPPARQWERAVDFVIKRCLAVGVYGKFAEFPTKATKLKYDPLIVTHFFIIWSFLIHFLVANCSVER